MTPNWKQRFISLHGASKRRPSRQAIRSGYSFMAHYRKPKLDKATRKALRARHIRNAKQRRAMEKAHRSRITHNVQMRLSVQFWPRYNYQPMYRWNLDVARATEGWWIPINATNPERHDLVHKGYWRESLGNYLPSGNHPKFNPAR